MSKKHDHSIQKRAHGNSFTTTLQVVHSLKKHTFVDISFTAFHTYTAYQHDDKDEQHGHNDN